MDSLDTIQRILFLGFYILKPTPFSYKLAKIDREQAEMHYVIHVYWPIYKIYFRVVFRQTRITTLVKLRTFAFTAT